MSAIKNFISDICWKKWAGMTAEEIAKSYQVPELITTEYVEGILKEWYEIICGEKEL